jgi:hypothetical protein
MKPDNQDKPSAAKDRNRKSYHEWKTRRDIALRSISLDVDLENREIFLQKDLKEKLNFDFPTNNVDRLISSYVAPEDSQNVKQSLIRAEKGSEEPIMFNFIHPLTSQKLRFEYRYEIIYVKYSSTRLHGVLVNIRDQNLRNRRQR